MDSCSRQKMEKQNPRETIVKMAGPSRAVSTSVKVALSSFRARRSSASLVERATHSWASRANSCPSACSCSHCCARAPDSWLPQVPRRTQCTKCRFHREQRTRRKAFFLGFRDAFDSSPLQGSFRLRYMSSTVVRNRVRDPGRWCIESIWPEHQ